MVSKRAGWPGHELHDQLCGKPSIHPLQLMGVAMLRVKRKLAALTVVVVISGCHQESPNTERKIAELETRIASLETRKSVIIEPSKPVVRDQFELLGLSGPRRIYESDARCMEALKSISRAEKERDRENQAEIGTPNANGSRIVYTGSVRHVLSCIPA